MALKIDGRQMAEEIYKKLEHLVIETGIKPVLQVFLIGDNPSSLSFIKMKEKAAIRIGAKLQLQRYGDNISNEIVLKDIENANSDPQIHGIIVQRPLPNNSQVNYKTLLSVNPHKDIDGFVQNSPYDVPVAKAVWRILGKIKDDKLVVEETSESLINWLTHSKVTIVGRGETAGKPIADLLTKKGIPYALIHSKTENPDIIMSKSDVIISCVGKSNIVRRQQIKKGCFLIGVGLSKNSEGKITGDYDEAEIEPYVKGYTPTPGGVGPLNVASLMENLIRAAHLTK